MTSAQPPTQVFVAGNSRSGTTMIANMLGRHPSMAVLREMHFFEQLWGERDRDRVLDPDEATSLASRLLHNQRSHAYMTWHRAVHEQEARAIVTQLGAEPRAHDVFAAVLQHEAATKGKAIPVEQTPRNVYFIDAVLELFPDSFVVVVVRDPRDVLVSQKNWWRRRAKGAAHQPRMVSFRHWADYHPITTSLLWRGGARAGGIAARRERAVEIRFEDVLADPEGTLRGVCHRLGLTFDPQMLEVRRFNSSIDEDGAEVGVDPAAAGRWQDGLDRTETWLSQRLNAAEMRARGYAPQAVRPSLWRLSVVGLSLPVKLALAFALNVGRTRSLVHSVRVRVFATGP